MNIITIALIIIVLAYSCLILFSAFFFMKTTSIQSNFKIDNYIKVSIIIPARNESLCIFNLLQSIKNQSYPFQFIEIIVVDDASSDNTSQIVQKFANQFPYLNCQVIRIEDNKTIQTYKKYAITKAIQASSGDLIITTDADCIVGTDWIAGIVNIYNKTQAKMIVGLVAYHKDENVFQKMQHLEFLSLIASGVASVEAGFPIMCNGANFIYERKAFDEVNGFDSNNKFASGDDVFLLLKIKKHFGGKSISVLKDKNTIVYTQAKKTISEFIQQRIRWASKAKGYKDVSILLVAVIVFLYNASIIITFLCGLKCNEFSIFSVYLFIIKTIVDFPILYCITKYVNRKDLLAYYLPLQIVYLPYILIIGSISSFVSYKWKGRTVKN